MNTRSLFGICALLSIASTAHAHHSFAAYNMDSTLVFTGVVTRINPDANHLQIFFAPMNDERKNVQRDADGKPVIWAVEMAGSAQAAKDGISVNSFPAGTIFTVTLHPLRDGKTAGTRGGTNGEIYKCPPKTPPAAGKHCDSVADSVTISSTPAPAADYKAPTDAKNPLPAKKPQGAKKPAVVKKQG
jgi:Family of unknown function (DUF6152)